MTFCLGLTGSIGMGKSTTADMFKVEGIPVWDADSAVHSLYAPGGGAVPPIAALYPSALKDGGINRASLREWISREPSALAEIEAVVHPLVVAHRVAFIAETVSDIAVFDIPLLFETGAQTQFDATLLVTAPSALQRARVLKRPGMSPEHFALIQSRQMPDALKRSLATHIVEALTLNQTRVYVQALIAHISGSHA